MIFIEGLSLKGFKACCWVILQLPLGRWPISRFAHVKLHPLVTAGPKGPLLNCLLAIITHSALQSDQAFFSLGLSHKYRKNILTKKMKRAQRGFLMTLILQDFPTCLLSWCTQKTLTTPVPGTGSCSPSRSLFLVHRSSSVNTWMSSTETDSLGPWPTDHGASFKRMDLTPLTWRIFELLDNSGSGCGWLDEKTQKNQLRMEACWALVSP